jgi:hypothetical protein
MRNANIDIGRPPSKPIFWQKAALPYLSISQLIFRKGSAGFPVAGKWSHTVVGCKLNKPNGAGKAQIVENADVLMFIAD